MRIEPTEKQTLHAVRSVPRTFTLCYAEFEAVFDIRTSATIERKLPNRATALVLGVGCSMHIDGGFSMSTIAEATK